MSPATKSTIASRIAERARRRAAERAARAKARRAEWILQDRMEEAIALNWLDLSSRNVRCND
jgi:hypothetical protein